jgi:hypothetical protein
LLVSIPMTGVDYKTEKNSYQAVCRIH